MRRNFAVKKERAIFSKMVENEIQLLIKTQKELLRSGKLDERHRHKTEQSKRRRMRKIVEKTQKLKMNDAILNARVKDRLLKIGSSKLAHNTTVRAKINKWSTARDAAHSDVKSVEKALVLLESVPDSIH